MTHDLRTGDNNDNSLTVNTIIKFLERVDCEFNPMISERISLTEYSKKIYEFAEINCFFNLTDDIVSLIAFYLNRNTSIGYITILATDPSYRCRGLGAKLLESCVNRCSSENMDKLMLEVSNTNYVALSLYYKNGFFQFAAAPKDIGKIFLEKTL